MKESEYIQWPYNASRVHKKTELNIIEEREKDTKHTHAHTYPNKISNLKDQGRWNKAIKRAQNLLWPAVSCFDTYTHTFGWTVLIINGSTIDGY